MRSVAEFTFSKKELYDFDAKCQAAIRNVGTGTKKATEQAAKEIMQNSMEQVPKFTTTLLSSAFYEVKRRTDTSAKNYAYEAVLGYGGNGDPVNPETGRPASSYMVVVHEDLDAFHERGKAKFLEDPIREYAESKFERTIFKCVRESLADMSD